MGGIKGQLCTDCGLNLRTTDDLWAVARWLVKFAVKFSLMPEAFKQNRYEA